MCILCNFCNLSRSDCTSAISLVFTNMLFYVDCAPWFFFSFPWLLCFMSTLHLVHWVLNDSCYSRICFLRLPIWICVLCRANQDLELENLTLESHNELIERQKVPYRQMYHNANLGIEHTCSSSHVWNSGKGKMHARSSWDMTHFFTFYSIDITIAG